MPLRLTNLLFACTIALNTPLTARQPVPLSAQPTVADTTTTIDFVGDTQQPMWVEKLFLRANHNPKATALIFSDILNRRPRAVYLLGDVVALGYRDRKWAKVDRFLDSCHQKGISTYGLLGNHDVMGRPEKGMTNFKKRFPALVRTGYWSMVDSTAIVLLNSNFSKLSQTDRLKQQTWYDSTLKSLDANPGIKAIIVTCHHAPYSNSKVVGSSKSVQTNFVPAFIASKKAVLFMTGHSHAFEYFTVHGKYFLVTGGGGGLHQPLDTSARRLPDLAPSYKPMFHYLQLDIRPDRLHLVSRALNDSFTGFSDGWSADIHLPATDTPLPTTPATPPTAAATIDNIHLDQFGYRCADQKIAVISSAQTGFYGSKYDPGTIPGQYQVRRWADNTVAYTGTLSAWNGGATQKQSGDKAWWFDFTPLSTPGDYYIYDRATGKASYEFRIDDQVYKDVLKQAMRSYFYLRCGMPKALPYAGRGWTDVACHIAGSQDKDCRLYNDRRRSTARDLSGGWHDAGDYNKYVGFTLGALSDLLLAYQDNPKIWTDDYDIPESGNGTPDILDEAKYELDWLLKMQQPDGSVLSIVGEVRNVPAGSPPSKDTGTRVYGPATTNASFVMAAVCALAAVQFNTIGHTTYATRLKNAAIQAYAWAIANPNVVFYNTHLIGAGEQEVGAGSYELSCRQLIAAIYLYKLTGENRYKTFVEHNFRRTRLLHHGLAYPFESAQQDALLNYAALPDASVPVKDGILDAYIRSVDTSNKDNLPACLNNADAYRAYLSSQNYTWGSNAVKGHQGLLFINMIRYDLNPADNRDYLNAASGYLHYLHGVNPTGFCYLSNMAAFGAERSVPEFYNSWFCDGSPLWDRVGVSTYGPAPGFVPGGPDAGYKPGGPCDPALVTPPLGQPVQKAFKDFNANWPLDSWQVTENGIYYEAAYIRLLSCFIGSPR